MVSKFGKELMSELKRSKLDGLAGERREGFSGMEPDTFAMMRTQKMIRKLTLTKAFIGATPATLSGSASVSEDLTGRVSIRKSDLLFP